jgi:tetratricopeptide (TPR) repeat protein
MRRRPALLVLVFLALALSRVAHAAFGEQARLEALFRAALSSWAAGDETAALSQLAKLDQAAAPGSRDAARLQKAKSAVAAAIARRSVGDRRGGGDSLLAAAALELRAYGDYSRRRSKQAAEARQAVSMLVERHAATDRRPAAAAMDAAVLASLGGELAEGYQQRGAQEMYERALALDPGQTAARLGLAAIEEQGGRYVAALDLLAPLVASPDASREARLRFALNSARVGRERVAEEELRRLTTGDVDWVRSLAAQELARILAGREEYAAAARLLTETAALLPCDPTLPVQAALLGERAGSSQPLDLASLGACGEAAESARSRYTHVPTSELVPLRASLVAALPAWRRALGRDLGLPAVAAVGQ